MNNEQNNISPAEPQLKNLTVDEASESILARWTDDSKNPSDNETEQTETEPKETEEQDQSNDDNKESEIDEELEKDPSEDTEELSDDDDQDTDASSGDRDISDDDEVEIIVDGETEKVSIKSLKRLHGQESSLTRKSQEVARQRKEAEEVTSKSQIVLDAMLKKAEEKYKPYKEVDMLLASKTMNSADFAQLRKESQSAYEDYNFLTNEAQKLYQDVQEQQKIALQNQAKEAVKVLQETVPNWSNTLYNDIRGYAIGQGFEEAEVNNYVDPKVIQILNKARLYDEGKKVANIKKANPTAKKVLKSKKAPPTAQNRKNADLKNLRKQMRTSTDLDDISNVLLSRWEK